LQTHRETRRHIDWE